MRIILVSAFLPDVTQQIHSLRASGVISSHTARAAGADIRALRKSSGIVCIVPPASLVILYPYLNAKAMSTMVKPLRTVNANAVCNFVARGLFII